VWMTWWKGAGNTRLERPWEKGEMVDEAYMIVLKSLTESDGPR